MPGLIFEGDTTKRFGEKFPKPFIQEIRVFDNAIEADIILYFKVSLEENVDNFIGNLSDYDLYSGFGNKSFRDEINLENFNIVNEEIFNSEGERFIKLMLEKRIDFGSELSSVSLSLESIIPNTGTEAEGSEKDLDFNPISFLNRFEDIGIDKEPIVSRVGIRPSSVTGDFEQDFGVDVFDSVRNTFKDGPQGTPKTTIDSGLFKFEEGTAISTIGDDAIAAIFGIGAEGKRLLGEFSLREYGSTTPATTTTPTDESRTSSITEIASAEAARAAAAGLTLQKYFYCCTTLKEDESSNLNIIQDLTIIDPTGGYNQIVNSSSPLIYERIFKFDGTLSIDPVDAYQELDGNIYGQTPLMSLDRRYRKTDNITHKTIIDNVNAVIAPYVGTETTEADNIAVTLQTHKDDPRLLIKLSKQTKNFSNKSSVTVGGQLYANMVDVITSLDNALLIEDVLEKRRFANAKIKDRRGDISLVKDNDFTEGMSIGLSCVYGPLVSRGVVNTSGRNVKGTTEELSENFILLNQAYYFFDYEKALNYETEISKFFNPYNLLQIFGNNCLNNFFTFQTVEIEKNKNPHLEDPTSTTTLTLGYRGILEGADVLGLELSYQTNDSTNNIYRKQITEIEETTMATKFGISTSRTEVVKPIFSQIVERAFDTLDSIDGYRLKCYEVVDLESLNTAIQPAAYLSRFEIKDTTMLFYRDYIRQPILKMYEDLKRYLDFADDFCSFNNIDGRFNDFFVDAVQVEFNSPFPWHEGPLLYHSVLAALQASWEGLGFETRKRRGSSIDLTLVKQNAILKSRQISPSTGDLTSLQQFVSDFGIFKDYFEVGSGLDKNNEIYGTFLGGTLSLKIQETSKTFNKTTQLPSQINSSFDIVAIVITKERFALGSEDGDRISFSEADRTINLNRENVINDMKKNAKDLLFADDITWEKVFRFQSAMDLEAQTKRVLSILVPYVESLNFLGFSLSIGTFLGLTEGEEGSLATPAL
tara:strand:+ start:1116 stop:4070 length:2955 start_codon:yes stop_codon:yes gene_type:complete